MKTLIVVRTKDMQLTLCMHSWLCMYNLVTVISILTVKQESSSKISVRSCSTLISVFVLNFGILRNCASWILWLWSWDKFSITWKMKGTLLIPTIPSDLSITLVCSGKKCSHLYTHLHIYINTLHIFECLTNTMVIGHNSHVRRCNVLQISIYYTSSSY